MASDEQGVESLHGNAHTGVLAPVDVPTQSLRQVLPDAVQLVGRLHRKERQLVHVGLDEALAGIGGVDAVDEALVVGFEHPAAPAALRHL